MRRLVVLGAFLLACVLVLPAMALKVGTIYEAYPIKVAPGSAVVISLAKLDNNTNRRNMPTGIMLFTGDGSEFFVRFKNDWAGSGTWHYPAAPEVVPGAATLPLPSYEVDGDSLRISVEINAATDTVSGYWTRQ